MAFGIGKKLKKGLGSIANKVADKLIPKELAPFLPMLAPLFMGPGAGIMSRYLMPQLLAALSTGKTSGDISGTGQALAGLGSFLSDPNRFKLGDTEAIDAVAEKKIVGPDKIIADQGTKDITRDIIDPSKLDRSFLESDLAGYGGNQGNVDFTDFQTGGRRSMYDATGGGLRQSPAVVGSETFQNPAFVPGSIEPGIETILQKGSAAVPSVPIYELPKDPTLMQRLKYGANEARDFMQGTNFANKRPGGDTVKVGKDSDLIGTSKGFNPYADANANFIGPEAPYQVGDPVFVKDANFGYNMPRRAVQTGITTLGPTMNKIDKMKQDAAEQEALFQSNLDAYGDAKDNFYNFFANAKPNYDLLYGGGYADGGRVGLNEGGSAENATNQFQMKLAELLEVGVPLEEAEKQAMDFMQRAFKGLGGDYADGGRVGLDEGGFLSNIFGDSTVDDIQRGLLGIMGATDSMLGMGMSEYDDAFQEMLDAGATEAEIIEMIGPRPDFTMQANGGRVNKNMGGIMNAGSIPQTPAVPDGMQLDGRGGGFIPMGAQERKDDVPAMLAKNEFVMTADAVRAAGGGSVEKGAQRMYDMMNQLEAQV